MVEGAPADKLAAAAREARACLQRRPAAWWLLPAGAVILVVLRARYGIANIIEDSWMMLAIARNLALGHGLVFNVGERVLSTCTPLYAVLLGTLGLVSGPDSIPWLAVYGNIIFDLCSFWVLYRWISTATESRGLGILCAWLFALDQRVIEYSTGAKDTAPYIFLILAALRAFQQRRTVWIGILNGLAVAVRPDGCLLSLAILPFMAWRDRRWPWRTMLVTMAIVLSYVAVIFWYYGSPIPQPVMGLQHIPRLQHGRWHIAILFAAQPALALYGRAFFLLWHRWSWSPATQTAFHFVLFMLQAGLCAWAAWRLAQRDPSIALSAFFAFLHVSFFILGNPVMYGWYEVPLEPLWTTGLAGAYWLLCRRGPRFAAALCGLGLVTAQCLHIAWAGDPRTLRLLADHWDRSREQAIERACHAIQANGIRPSDTVLTPLVGSPRWHLNARVLDTWGIVYPEVLRYQVRDAPEHWPQHPAFSPEFVLDAKPRYLIVTDHPFAEIYRQDSRFLRTYRLLYNERLPTSPFRNRLRQPTKPFWLQVYVRKEDPTP